MISLKGTARPKPLAQKSVTDDINKRRQRYVYQKCMVLHTFNQLCFAENCSYLQPQMILKDESGFLEILQSVFVCSVLRFNHWNVGRKNKCTIQYSHSLISNSYVTPSVSQSHNLTFFSLGLFFFKLLNLLDNVLFLHILLLNLRYHFRYCLSLLF